MRFSKGGVVDPLPDTVIDVVPVPFVSNLTSCVETGFVGVAEPSKRVMFSRLSRFEEVTIEKKKVYCFCHCKFIVIKELKHHEKTKNNFICVLYFCCCLISIQCIRFDSFIHTMAIFYIKLSTKL